MAPLIAIERQRARRQVLEFNAGSNKKVLKPRIHISGNNNNLSLWADKSDKDTDSNGLKTVNSVLKDGSDLLGAPGRLANSIQQNWFVYLILIAVILVCILLLYCIIRYHCSKKASCLKKQTRSSKSRTDSALLL
ncbi:hypothetical protein I4U23_015719 [Adineta vaga]|nr:hypothetical protein I4U23_015719 [Adineta vaga]